MTCIAFLCDAHVATFTLQIDTLAQRLMFVQSSASCRNSTIYAARRSYRHLEMIQLGEWWAYEPSHNRYIEKRYKKWNER